MFLTKWRKKKENRKKEKKEIENDISIIPQVPVASLVFLPYYKNVLFAGRLSSEIKLKTVFTTKRKNHLYHLAKTEIANIQLEH